MLDKLLNIYQTNKIFLVKVTKPKYIATGYASGYYEKDEMILSAIVYKKGDLYYNVITDEVYSDYPYDKNKYEFIIYEKSNLNSKAAFITRNQLLEIYNRVFMDPKIKEEYILSYKQKCFNYLIESASTDIEILDKCNLINNYTHQYLKDIYSDENLSFDECMSEYKCILDTFLYPYAKIK